MAMLQIDAVIIRKPCRAIRFFPDQQLERKIDRRGGRRQHERRARLGIAEDNELAGPHGKPRLLGLATMIDNCEQLHSLGGQYFLQPLDGLVH